MATDQDIIDEQLRFAGFQEPAPRPAEDDPVVLDDGEELDQGQCTDPNCCQAAKEELADDEEDRSHWVDDYTQPQSRAVTDLLSILTQRGNQYGQAEDDKANLRASASFDVDPIIATAIRANDKWVRLQNLTRERTEDGLIVIRGAEHYEQIRDQMLDIAGYMVKDMELLDERMGR